MTADESPCDCDSDPLRVVPPEALCLLDAVTLAVQAANPGTCGPRIRAWATGVHACYGQVLLAQRCRGDFRSFRWTGHSWVER